MATYIGLINYTGQGMANIKDSPGRLDAAREALGSMGIEFKAFYLTFGQYDAVTVMEAPDDETMAMAILATASQGNISTQTLKAFTEEQARAIVDSLP